MSLRNAGLANAIGRGLRNKENTMYELLIKLFFAIVVASITWWANHIWFNKNNLAVFIIVAVATTTSYCFIDKISELISAPKVDVVLLRRNNTLGIRISSDRPLDLFDLDLPLHGEVVKNYDFVESGDAKSSKYEDNKTTFYDQISGTSYQSNIHIKIENMVQNKELRYVLEIKEMPPSITFGTDYYKVSYQWNFNGNLKTRTEWFSQKSLKKIKEPNLQIGSYKVH